MLWRVRATLPDRPGALAVLADRCGASGINILNLQVFPRLGRVTDEMILATPEEWEADRVLALVVGSGGEEVAVHECAEQDLVDAPTTYLRAALRLLDEPEGLTDALAELLGAEPGAARGPGGDTLSALGGLGEVWRDVPFTDSERARVAVLAAFPDRALRPPPRTEVVGRPEVRPARRADAAALRRMHERCSVRTLARRYHSPMTRLVTRHEVQLLDPVGGASFVAAVGDEVVGTAMVAPHDGATKRTVLELGILVEDGWQGQGVGSTLLRAALDSAAELDAAAVVAITQPQNRALLALVKRCGLTCRARHSDGLLHLLIPVERPDRGDSAEDRGTVIAYRQA